MENSEEILTWIDKAIAVWRGQQIELLPGATIHRISEVEGVIGFKFPADFVNFYLRVNGFKDFGWNNDMFSMWPLGRIIEEYEEIDNDFVPFCDFLINSHQIGFVKSQSGVFKSYDRSKPIANSFKEAIELINSNSDLIY